MEQNVPVHLRQIKKEKHWKRIAKKMANIDLFLMFEANPSNKNKKNGNIINLNSWKCCLFHLNFFPTLYFLHANQSGMERRREEVQVWDIKYSVSLGAYDGVCYWWDMPNFRSSHRKTNWFSMSNFIQSYASMVFIFPHFLFFFLFFGKQTQRIFLENAFIQIDIEPK